MSSNVATFQKDRIHCMGVNPGARFQPDRGWHDRTNAAFFYALLWAVGVLLLLKDYCKLEKRKCER